MNINKYKLKKGININYLINDGFKYSVDYKYVSKYITLKSSIKLWLKVRLSDFSLKIEILDIDYGQPYIPFYNYIENKDIEPFPFLKDVIEKYIYEIHSIKYLEIIE